MSALPASALIHRRLTADDEDGFGAVAWAHRAVAVLDARGQSVFFEPSVEAPERWSPLAVATVARRYFLREPGGRRERSVRALVQRVVETLARWSGEAGYLPRADQRAALAAELTALVITQRAAFATPVWLNLGADERPVTAACFILSVEDSLPALLDWNRREGLIFRQGAGAGANLSRVRSSREPVSRGGLASGPVSFMRGADAWAATIRSGGRARRGAKMVVLDAEHPDVLDFAAAKPREEERAEALVAAGWSREEATGALAFQQANHAVRVSDEFMQAALAGESWELRAVTTGEVVRRLPARALLRACARAAWRCGDPGLLFASTIERWHTCPRSGPISASNPCGEFLAIDDSACNLAALNLRRFTGRDGFDVDAFTHAVELMVLAQDLLVSGSAYPTREIERNAQRFRQLGLGYTNLGGLLMSLGLPYDSERGRGLAVAITALMTGVAYRRSVELATELGPFDELEPNREPMLAVLERHAAAAAAITRALAPPPVLDAALQAWDDVIEGARTHGVRNAQVTLVAPTGTISLMMDCDTTGIEPAYALVYRKRFAEGGEARLTCTAVLDGLLALGYRASDARRLANFAAAHADLGDAPGLRPEHRGVFATATGPGAIAPSGHLEMVAAVQPLVSGGVSKTLPLPVDATVDDVETVFIQAWRLGLKAISVFRQQSKMLQPLTPQDSVQASRLS